MVVYLRRNGKALPALERYGSTADTHAQLTRPFRRADIVRMPSVSGSYTLEKWERLPRDGNRYELLDGELLVTPSPGPLHQTLVARLTVALASYVDAHHLGQVWPGLDMFHGPRTVLEPDVAVGLGPAARRLRSWKELRGPALAIEVLSPSSRRYDRDKKRAVYLAHGCEYWIVDPEDHCIERWLPGGAVPSTHHAALQWHPDPSVAPLTLDVASLFAELT